MTYKHKMHSVDSDGKIVSNMDTNFFINDVSFICFRDLLFNQPALAIYCLVLFVMFTWDA